MTLLDKRLTYAPREYPQAFSYWEQQQKSHWLHYEIAIGSDIHDFKIKLTDNERKVVGNILKSFVQMEIIVGEYWSSKVLRWFPKPEVAMMASTFSAMESIHTAAYSYLNESLGLDDFEAFLYEPTGKAKLDRLTEIPGSSVEEIALSLAIFSAFSEGVSLFSSFSILLNFSRFDKLKKIGEIIAFSVKDESLHSTAGCWLFRTLMKEFPDVFTDELKKKIYDAARTTIELEDNFIDMVFEGGPVEGMDPKDLKAFMRHRCNTKLVDLGLKTNWKNIDKECLARMAWFDSLSAGVMQQDFFAGRVSDYSKGVITFDNSIFDEDDLP